MVGGILTIYSIGSNRFGLDTVLVFTGNALARNSKARINSLGIIPTYIGETAVIEWKTIRMLLRKFI